MTDRGSAQPGPVRLTENSRVAFRPATHGSISAGLWAERRRVNRDVSVPEGWRHLHDAGNFHNLELAGGLTTGEYVNNLPFLDSDLYKWLEAIGWALAELLTEGPSPVAGTSSQLAPLLGRLGDYGYLDSSSGTLPANVPTAPWVHELYCIGHLTICGRPAPTTSDGLLLDFARKATT